MVSTVLLFGTVVGRDCTTEVGTRCVRCENGTFMNRSNSLKKCFPCSSCDPGHGLFPKQECSPTSDTFCEALNGFFCRSVTSSGCTEAEKHSVCKPGQRIKEPGTNRRDAVCEDCQEGYFSSEGVTCSLWAKCSESQTKVEEGSSVSDVVCRNKSTRNRFFLFLLILPVGLVFGVIYKVCGNKVPEAPQSPALGTLEEQEVGSRNGDFRRRGDECLRAPEQEQELSFHEPQLQAAMMETEKR
ncbi:tumor necrosis factor receptor superfamily member 14 isoform X2 [Kryptolebias marmoratus]|uniref:tumor necrosis factor receptor superfamily member 14 isoform X2 n=1 Tax=Kryptolebias marmoratus TaxID=37003 RepID=UPI0007F8B415|nr:tumor necrosis factor receptor superfamily member 14 isoform X2 [Kryptolebias marmoratus]